MTDLQLKLSGAIGLNVVVSGDGGSGPGYDFLLALKSVGEASRGLSKARRDAGSVYDTLLSTIRLVGTSLQILETNVTLLNSNFTSNVNADLQYSLIQTLPILDSFYRSQILLQNATERYTDDGRAVSDSFEPSLRTLITLPELGAVYASFAPLLLNISSLFNKRIEGVVGGVKASLDTQIMQSGEQAVNNTVALRENVNEVLDMVTNATFVYFKDGGSGSGGSGMGGLALQYAGISLVVVCVLLSLACVLMLFVVYLSCARLAAPLRS
jgi:hypothetical protein